MARRTKVRVDSRHAVPSPRSMEGFVNPAPSPTDSMILESPREERHDPEPHQLERAVLHELLSHPEVVFSSLVVRRTPGGVCLQGVVECESTGIDVCSIVRRIAGVDQVLSQLVMHSPSRLAESSVN